MICVRNMSFTNSVPLSQLMKCGAPYVLMISFILAATSLAVLVLSNLVIRYLEYPSIHTRTYL